MAGLQDTHDTTSHDDTSPLLCESGLASPFTRKPSPTPLPKVQIAAVCAIRLVDPVAFTQIFPYVNELVDSLHVTKDPSQIGFYSGLIESAFMAAQVLSIYHWARVSDRHGRRPVVLFGTAAIAITTIVLGLSRTLPMVLITRILSGLCSGNIPALQSILGEITDSTNRATAVSIYGALWPIGSTLGPLIGGTFSDPASKFPPLLDTEFLRQFPYFLPCFMASLVAIFAAVFSYFFLNETLPPTRRYKSEKQNSEYGAITDEPSLDLLKEPPSIKALLAIPKIHTLTMSAFAFGFQSTAFDVVFALFCYSSIGAGGLGFTTSQIGYALAMAGCISASLQLGIMPSLLRSIRPGKLYLCCMSMWPPTYLMFPLLNLVARHGFDEGTESAGGAGASGLLLWIGVAVVMTLSRVACMSSSVIMMLANQHAPDPSCLGATNGLVGFGMCLARAFAPAIVSSCYAFSTGSTICGGYLWVVVMVVLSCLGCHTTKALWKM